jgi:phosphate transport system substrate-binding protein
MMTASPGAIVRRGGISRTVFIISLVIVGAVSGVSGYIIQGVLHPAPPTITLNGAGSSFVFPFITAVDANYSKINSNIQINYQSIGSGAGITALGQRTVDFGASDAPLTNSQVLTAPNALTIPDTIGAVVIAYNIPAQFSNGTSYMIHKGLFLNVTVTAEIFQGGLSSGGTMYWDDPGIIQLNQNNPNIPAGVVFPHTAITVVHRFDSSGTTFVFTGYLSSSSVWLGGQSKQPKATAWAASALSSPQNAGVASTIQTVPDTIGYVELNYALSANPPMTYAYLWNPNGSGSYIAPTLTSSGLAASSLPSLPAGSGNWTSVNLLNSKDPGAYPIVTFSYIMVFQELNVYGGAMSQTRAQAIVNYLWFVVHDGQNQAPILSYVALPSSVVTNAEATIRSITYNGQTLHS